MSEFILAFILLILLLAACFGALAIWVVGVVSIALLIGAAVFLILFIHFKHHDRRRAANRRKK